MIPQQLLRNTDRDSHSSEKHQSGKIPVGEWERRDDGREREVTQESLSESDQGKGGSDQKREDKKPKGENKWRNDEKNLQYGGREVGQGRGDEDDRSRDKMSRDKGGRPYREEEAAKRSRNIEERGGGDRYPGKDRGGAVKGRSDKNGSGGGSMRDKYDRGVGSDRKGGGGDTRRKKGVEVEKKKLERGQDRRPETGRGKEDEKKERDEALTR